MTILEQIAGPEDVHNLSLEDLGRLTEELRRRIIDVVNRNGGHLASPLGVVDLTVALHYVLDVGRDQLIWDVGHQCYAHKLLTGRADCFDSLRRQGGISGYPSMSESPYDAFGTGHSSTSISAAVGMAVARDRRREDHKVVAVIGDGAMTGGMAFEALSHAGQLGLDMLVILNDNDMSISANVGALARYFNRLIMAGSYKRAKEDVGSFVKTLVGERMTRRIQDLEKSVKGFITHGHLFQELGFNYIGPVDGHDLPLLIECLSRMNEMKGPILFHCRTEKGKGLKEAEDDPVKYHGIKPHMVRAIEDEGGSRPAPDEARRSPAPTFTDAFANALIEAGEKDPDVVAITAAMPTGTGLSRFAEVFPDRCFDVGICEQHAVTFAAGLAARGAKPVVAIYSTFLQRGYDQLIHDVCIQDLPVVFALDRAGLVGEDSPTQCGTFDLSFLRAVPDLSIVAPRDALDTALLLRWALRQNRPAALRFARSGAGLIGATEDRDVSVGEELRVGHDATFLVVGPCAANCLEAAQLLEEEGLSVGVADARHIKPLDGDLLFRLADRPIITVEENTLPGGFGAAVIEFFADRGHLEQLRITRVGLPDVFARQATRKEQLAAHGLDARGLAETARKFLVRYAAAPAQ